MILRKDDASFNEWRRCQSLIVGKGFDQLILFLLKRLGTSLQGPFIEGKDRV